MFRVTIRPLGGIGPPKMMVRGVEVLASDPVTGGNRDGLPALKWTVNATG